MPSTSGPKTSESFASAEGLDRESVSALRSEMPAQFDLLTKVSILRSKNRKRQVIWKGPKLRDTLYDVSWGSTPSFELGGSYQGNAGVIYGSAWGSRPNSSFLMSDFDNTEIIEHSIQIVPNPDSPVYIGTIGIGFGLPTANSDPDIDGWVGRISFLDGYYTGTLVKKSGGLTIKSATSATYSDLPNTPGVLSVRIEGTAITLYWRDQKLCETTDTITSFYSCLKSTSSNSTIQVSAYVAEWLDKPGVQQVDRNQRYDKLVCISEGKLYRETSVNELEHLASSIGFTSGYQLTACDREQKLYIADYGTTNSGTGGILEIRGSQWGLSSAGTDWEGLGVTEGYVITISDSGYTQNEQQRVTLNFTDGGYFTLTFKGAQTAPIAWDASAATLESTLEALATIDDVTVTGSNGGPWLIEFQGDLSATNVEKLSGTSAALTNTGAETPTLRVDDVQEGRDGTAIAGNYRVVGVYPDWIDFDPPLPSGVPSGTTATFAVAKPPKVYDAQADTLDYLEATSGKGAVPVGCRLVALYRDRLVLAAQDETPHIFYMSRQGDPKDWDYTQEDSGAAVFSQASIAGQLADPITALIAHSDECLVIGCYHSLWMLRGDPGYGGTVDQVSRKIGIVGPHAWTRTPEDMVVFLSADGLYVMPSGCNGFPTSLSRERLPDELLALTIDDYAITLEYDVVSRGIHIFVTQHDAAESAHWWFDWEAKAFWRVSLREEHEPTAVHERLDWASGPTVLLGCRDGFIRKFDRAFAVDDGNHPIESYCMIGPFHLDRHGFNEGVLTELHAHLGSNSGSVDFEVSTGSGHEEAYRADPVYEGTWDRTGLNYTQRPRARGVSAMIKVKGSGDRRHWFLERITAAVRSAGKKRVHE